MRELEARQKEYNIQRTNAAMQEALAVARNKQDNLLQTVRSSTNALGDLLVTVMRLDNELSALKNNAAGRALSPYPDLVAQARRLYQDVARDVPAQSEVVSRLEAARRVEQQLLSALGTAYDPDASLSSSAQESLVWAGSEKRTADGYDALVSSLEREAKAKVSLTPVADPPPLEDAMKQLTAAEESARQKVILQKTAGAKDQAANLQAQGEARVIVAKGEASKTGADIEAQKILDDAKKQLLREKAAKPDIQTQLAAYLTPGYWTPKPGEANTYDKKPISYSELQEMGALDASMKGLRAFVAIGVNPRNDRPRLQRDFQYAWWNIPALQDQAKNLQQLMIELGPTLVEMGLMEK